MDSVNVIVALIDTLRRDFVGCYGNPWIRTPAIDRLAQRSTVFDNAYIGSYPCMPARREIWTGRYEFPWRGWGPLEDTEVQLAGLVKEAGRTSFLVTDHFHLWERGSGNYHFDFTGVEFIRGQENDNWVTDPDIPIRYPAAQEKLAGHARPGSFERYSRNVHGRRTEKDYFAPMVMQRAIDWLEKNRGHKDFLLLIDCFDPHEPFDPPEPYRRMYDPDYHGEEVIWPTYGWNPLSEEETRHVRALYAGEVTMVDYWLGRLIDKVEQLGLMDNTMIIVATDHGHMFGEHGIMGKPWSALSDSNLYQEIAHIPLIVYHPGAAEPGRRVSALVQPVDLFPTILEALGVRVPEGIHGRSLLPYVLEQEQPGPIRDLAIYGRFGEAVNVTDREWTLFLWPPLESNQPLYWYSPRPPQYGKAVRTTGPFEATFGRWPVSVARGTMNSALYHLPSDPRQERNLIDERPEVLRRLVEGLRNLWRQIGAPPEVLLRVGIDG